MIKSNVPKELDHPIFIIGVGRSGSTLFHHILTAHPQVAWLSPLCELFPKHPFLNSYLMEVIDVPFLRRWIHAGEFYKCWEQVYPGLRASCRDLEARDLTLKQKIAFRKLACAFIGRRRNRLVVKMTGWSRIGLLKTAFPSAQFIHVLRDGRAVANSLLHASFWKGRRGPENWRWGPLPKKLAEEWQEYDRSFIALAGLQWKMLVESVEETAEDLSSKEYYRLRYEDLCASPVDVLQEVIAFCNLSWSEDFAQRLVPQDIESTNFKWRYDLTESQQQVLEALLADTLKNLGYIVN